MRNGRLAYRGSCPRRPIRDGYRFGTGVAVACPTMQNKTQNERKAAGIDGGSFTNDGENSSGEPNENKKPGRESVAGTPSNKDNESKRNYHAERHKSTEQCRADDQVPSAGWRAVYFAMGVDVR